MNSEEDGFVQDSPGTVQYPGTLLLYYIYIFIYTGTRVPGYSCYPISGYPGTRFCTRVQYPVLYTGTSQYPYVPGTVQYHRRHQESKK